MNNNINNSLLQRYDNFFGNTTSQKLLKAKQELKNNLFIRINLSKTTPQKIEQFFNKNRIKYSKTIFQNAYKIEKSFFNLSSSLFSLTGQIYLQDLASQIPINTINFNKLKNQNKKIQILDMASAPGSKTTQLADMLEYHKIKYHITCLEPEKNRIKKLINNIQKQNFKNISIYQTTAQQFKTKQKYDIILLDAPCSGNLIDDKSWLQKRDLSGIKQKAKIQKELLIKASKLLKNKGEIIYSTCSLEPEENEHNIEFITQKTNLKTKPIETKFPYNTTPLQKDQHSLRFMPYNSKTQGFFVCKLKN
jgi:16S rRNA C967 or C1407 C5-methylase (RsmB/RsmF family)